MRRVRPHDSSPNYTILHMWNNQLTDTPDAIKLGLEEAESLPAGSDQSVALLAFAEPSAQPIGRAKITMRRWGFIDNTQSVNCDLANITVTERQRRVPGSGDTLCDGHEGRSSCWRK